MPIIIIYADFSKNLLLLCMQISRLYVSHEYSPIHDNKTKEENNRKERKECVKETHIKKIIYLSLRIYLTRKSSVMSYVIANYTDCIFRKGWR